MKAKIILDNYPPTDVDMSKLMEIGQKLNQQMMSIVKQYNKF